MLIKIKNNAQTSSRLDIAGEGTNLEVNLGNCPEAQRWKL